MIAHIVLLKPRSTLTAEQRQQMSDAVAAGLRRCPTVASWRIGRRVLHGLPGYEQMMKEDFEFALILEFKDVRGLTEYLAHSEHQLLGRLFSDATDAALAYDYEF